LALPTTLAWLSIMVTAVALSQRLTTEDLQQQASALYRHEARLAAEAALAFCERALDQAGLTPPSIDDPAAPSWQSMGDPQATGATDAWPMRPPMWPLPSPAPECLVESLRLPRERGSDERLRAFRITARGFASDARDNRSGTQIWLQSFVEQ
jgi:Tfp pilus assembly protein PilX